MVKLLTKFRFSYRFKITPIILFRYFCIFFCIFFSVKFSIFFFSFLDYICFLKSTFYDNNKLSSLLRCSVNNRRNVTKWEKKDEKSIKEKKKNEKLKSCVFFLFNNWLCESNRKNVIYLNFLTITILAEKSDLSHFLRFFIMTPFLRLLYKPPWMIFANDELLIILKRMNF